MKRLKTKRLEIRPVNLEDVSWLVTCKNDDLVRKMSVGLKTEITYENQMNDVVNSLKNKHQIYDIICLKKNPIGYIRLDYLDFDHMYAWLRFGMSSHRGEGYCKEALQAVINQLWATEVVRIEAEVYEYNIASYKLLETLGFKREGVKRKAHFEEGFHDVYVYGLLKEGL